MDTEPQTCIHCGQPLKVWQQGCNPQRVNGEIQFTATRIYGDCRNPACCVYMVTLTVEALATIPADYLKKAVR